MRLGGESSHPCALRSASCLLPSCSRQRILTADPRPKVYVQFTHTPVLDDLFPALRGS